MATLFEVWLVGDDVEHLTAIGEAVLDEIQRIESLLSRFDPASEIYRVNQNAATRPVLVDFELYALLQDGARRFEQTEGFFSIAQLTPVSNKPDDAWKQPAARARIPDSVHLVDQQRTVTFTNECVALDLGGYGKGYALDSASRILQQYGVGDGILHGGTSSILAHGLREDGRPWLVGLRDPFSNRANEEVITLAVTNCGISTSMVFDGLDDENERSSDIFRPAGHSWEELAVTKQAACSVITPAAVDAEVLSTALLAMGKDRAGDYLDRNESRVPSRCCVAWMERREDQTVLEWLRGSPHEFESE